MAKKAVKRTVVSRVTKRQAVKRTTRTRPTRPRPRPTRTRSIRTQTIKLRSSKRKSEKKVQQSVRSNKKKLTTKKTTSKTVTGTKRVIKQKKLMTKNTSRSSAKMVSTKKKNSKKTSAEYEVEKICDIKFQDGGEMFLVKWKGYAMKHNTWESGKNLGNATEAIDAFHSTHVYEVETITKSKMIGGERHYRVRWRGWPAKFDTWEPRASLMKGAKLEVSRFEKIQKKRKA